MRRVTPPRHDSDPAKDYNPLYRLAGRGEGLRDASSLTASYPWLDACLAATVAAVRERPPRIVPDSLLELPAPTASG